MAEDVADGIRRACIDPDDFTGQFAVWSGTSFAAPWMAARIADGIGAAIETGGADDRRVARVKRGWEVVSGLTSIVQ